MLAGGWQPWQIGPMPALPSKPETKAGRRDDRGQGDKTPDKAPIKKEGRTSRDPAIKVGTKARKEPASGTRRQRRGVKLKPTQLRSVELGFAPGPAVVPPEVAALAAQIEEDGGRVLCAYREPLGGHVLLFSALPVARVVPTPFQRDLSDTHVRRLTVAMDKTRRFLDPIIALREAGAAAAVDPDARYWTPNGYHRLTALKELGAQAVLALVVPERQVAYQTRNMNVDKIRPADVVRTGGPPEATE